jgi:hypothetical protein
MSDAITKKKGEENLRPLRPLPGANCGTRSFNQSDEETTFAPDLMMRFSRSESPPSRPSSSTIPQHAVQDETEAQLLSDSIRTIIGRTSVELGDLHITINESRLWELLAD